MPQLVKPTLHPQIRKPVLAIRRSTSHRPQQAAVDLDDFLDSLRSDPVTRSSTRIRGDDDAAFEAEGEGGGAVGDLDGALRVGVVVGHGAQPGGVGGDGWEGEVEGDWGRDGGCEGELFVGWEFIVGGWAAVLGDECVHGGVLMVDELEGVYVVTGGGVVLMERKVRLVVSSMK